MPGLPDVEARRGETAANRVKIAACASASPVPSAESHRSPAAAATSRASSATCLRRSAARATPRRPLRREPSRRRDWASWSTSWAVAGSAVDHDGRRHAL